MASSFRTGYNTHRRQQKEQRRIALAQEARRLVDSDETLHNPVLRLIKLTIGYWPTIKGNKGPSGIEARTNAAFEAALVDFGANQPTPSTQRFARQYLNATMRQATNNLS